MSPQIRIPSRGLSRKSHAPHLYTRLLWSVAALLATAIPAAAATINGSTPYLNGANVPWNQFGIDFGTHPSWGANYNGTWFNTAFAAMHAQGINAARI